MRNSICERKKKLSISKNRIKRKSIIMIKSILNEVKSNSKVLTSKQSQLQSLALKAKELRTIDQNDCTKTVNFSFIHAVFCDKFFFLLDFK